MTTASASRSKSTQRAKKARVAARTRAISTDAGEDIDGCDCDFTTDITLDEDLPPAFGAVEAPPKSRRRKRTSPKKTATKKASAKSTSRRSTSRKSSRRRTGTSKRSTKTTRGS